MIDSPQAQTQRYSERLTVPVWWWAVGLALLILPAAEIHMGSGLIPIWAAYLVLLPLPLWALLTLGRAQVSVVSGDAGAVELRVGDAHLPRACISRVAAIGPRAKSAALGRQLDPAAFVRHRPWIGSMLLVVVDDPDDPTPYWLVSSRHPERLIEALG